MSEQPRSLAEDTAKLNWSILIIDDVFDNLAIMRITLARGGFQVYTAQSAEACFAVLETVTPTAILLDIRMPKVDGLEVFRIIRADPKTKHIPVIAVTAHVMPGDQERILEAGFDGYIAKPFAVVKLTTQVRDFIIQAHSKR
ncbi:MAG: response regulator [Chloroflexota bacterium]|nr:response regulator [Chloroflexota bacterium]